MIFAREKVADVWDEAMVLARNHWLELEEHRHSQGFNPDKKRYLHCEDIGMYYHFGGRVNGRLVASSGIYIVPSMHTQRMIAVEDTFYVVPEFRGRGRSIFRFLAFTEDFARDKGVEEFTLTTSLMNSKAERVVQFMGYRQTTKGWSKNLYPEAKQEVA